MVQYPRIKELREEWALSKAAIAHLCSIPAKTYCRYEKGLSRVSVAHIIALADFYGVNVDYLVGLTDERRPYPHD